MKQVTLHIKGLVQGVGYRAETRAKAQELGLRGFVCNNPDGSVSAVAQGPETAIKSFMEWCWQGPDMAKVEDIEIEEKEIENYSFDGFLIKK